MRKNKINKKQYNFIEKNIERINNYNSRFNYNLSKEDNLKLN